MHTHTTKDFQLLKDFVPNWGFAPAALYSNVGAAGSKRQLGTVGRPSEAEDLLLCACRPNVTT